MRVIGLLVLPALLLAAEPRLLSRSPLEGDELRLFSPNQEFSALVTYRAGNSEFVPFERFRLHDRQGNVLYTLPDCGYTLADIADNGIVVGIEFDGPVSGRARLHFLDAQGLEQGRAEVDFLNDRAFSGNSDVYCVNDGKQGVRVFDARGQELHNLGRANWLAVSTDGRIVAAARDQEIVIFTNGRAGGRIPLSSPFVRRMRFAPDGSRFGFVDRKLLAVYRLPDLKPLFEYREVRPELNFISLDIAPDDSLIAATQDRDPGRGAPDRHRKGKIRLFDDQGNERWSEELDYGQWNAYVPEVDFTSERGFRVRTAEARLDYRY